ncbi:MULTISPECIES: ATP-dependent DNA ligase [Streptomyces]|uniref:ATP-dependent DNA ligase n=1 Tax=Streptomyces TaxID=1883 RepID=UPI001FFDCF47|nr:hypothetical protein [Streptomyces sp. RK31]
MLATPVPDPALRPGWASEPKWDGFRALISVDAGRVVLRSRRGTEMAASFPEIVAGAAQLPDDHRDGRRVGRMGGGPAHLRAAAEPPGRGLHHPRRLVPARRCRTGRETSSSSTFPAGATPAPATTASTSTCGTSRTACTRPSPSTRAARSSTRRSTSSSPSRRRAATRCPTAWSPRPARTASCPAPRAPAPNGASPRAAATSTCRCCKSNTASPPTSRDGSAGPRPCR